MVAVNQPLGQVQAFRTRLTALDSNGVPTPGANSSYVSGSIVSLKATAVYVDGDHLEQKNGEGIICVHYDGDDSLLRMDFDLVICTPDPYLLDLAVEGSQVISATGLPTTQGHAGSPADLNRPYGWAMTKIGGISREKMAIEVWSKRVDSSGVLDPDYPYAWWLLPGTEKRRISDTILGNGIVAPTITGKAYENLNWFDGPTENWPTASDRVLQWIPCKASDVPAASTQYTAVASS